MPTTKSKTHKAPRGAKKRHPADVADRDAILAAAEFAAFLRRGPKDVTKEAAASLKEAVQRADAIRAANPGRDVLVYAVTAAGASVPVPRDMQDAARSGTAPAGTLRPAKRGSAASPGQGAEKTATRKAVEAKGAKPVGKRAAIEEAARRGELPAIPDFSAATHARFRRKLDEVVALVRAGNIKGLKAFEIKPVSSSPKAIDRYRNLAVLALQARV